jgi:aryl-alcohol dehydrogenase-like predicted oxidoreductase
MGTQQMGRWISEKESHSLLDRYSAGGGNIIDTANCYPMKLSCGAQGGRISEAIVGRWLKKSANRGNMIIATKVSAPMSNDPNNQGLSFRHIVAAAEDSLRRLGIDYLDIYQAHDDDLTVRQTEVIEAFDNLRSRGLIRYSGCSNFEPWRVMRSIGLAKSAGKCSISVVQVKYNSIERFDYEGQLAGLCETENLGVLVYQPLAKGFLTGKYINDITGNKSKRAEVVSSIYHDRRFMKVARKIAIVAEKHGSSCAKIALSWALKRKSVSSAIVGMNDQGQLEQIMAAVGEPLSDEDYCFINS